MPVVGALLNHTSYTLPDNVENVYVGGTDAFDATGNELANVLYGNYGDDTLRGAGGDDTLNGNLRLDTLIGGDDNDTCEPPPAPSRDCRA